MRLFELLCNTTFSDLKNDLKTNWVSFRMLRATNSWPQHRPSTSKSRRRRHRRYVIIRRRNPPSLPSAFQRSTWNLRPGSSRRRSNGIHPVKHRSGSHPEVLLRVFRLAEVASFRPTWRIGSHLPLLEVKVRKQCNGEDLGLRQASNLE